MPGEAAATLSRGRLSLDFSLGPDGKSYISHQLATYPFHVCRAHYLDPQFPGLVTLYTQSCSGGLYAGDRFTTTVHVHVGAAVHLTTQASTIMHATKGDRAVSSTAITCEDKTFLEYVPDPLILFAGARLQSNLAVVVQRSSVALIADSFLCHDPERLGRLDINYESRISIGDLDGYPLAQEKIRISDDLMSSGLVGIMGAFQAYGSVVILLPLMFRDAMIARTRETASKLAEAVLGISALPNHCGLSVRILASDGVSLRKAIVAVWSDMRVTVTGHLPPVRRK
jgi:urease accessory protein